jgi:hypothetical protein
MRDKLLEAVGWVLCEKTFYALCGVALLGVIIAGIGKRTHHHALLVVGLVLVALPVVQLGLYLLALIPLLIFEARRRRRSDERRGTGT